MVSQPNAIGSRRAGRSRSCCMNSPNMAGDSLPRCCAWSRASRTGLNGGAHAAEACASKLGRYAERQVSQEPTDAPKACQVLTAAELAAVAPE